MSEWEAHSGSQADGAAFTAQIGDLARSRPDSFAVADGSRVLTYSEFWREAGSWRTHFAEQGVGPDDCVAVWASNGVEWLASLVAASSLGAAILSVNTNFRSHEVEQLLERVRPKMLVLSSSFRGVDATTVLERVTPSILAPIHAAVLLDGDADQRVRLSRIITTVSSPSSSEDSELWAPEPEVHAARRAVMFTSSGTTGAPKLIVHSKFGFSAHLNAVADRYRLREPGARVMSPMPFCGVMGLETAMAGLISGAGVATLPVFEAKSAVGQLSEFGATTLTCSDEALRRILHVSVPDDTKTLRDVALAVFGNDPTDLFDEAKSRGFRAFQTYGSSEVHALMCYPTPDLNESSFTLGGGAPITPMHHVRATGPEGEILPDFQSGTLEVLTPHLMLGYLVESDMLDRPLTHDGYFRTGDMGYTVPHVFVYLARLSDAIRLGGFLVEPGEIETYLVSTFGFAGAQVVGVDDHGRTKAVAFVVHDCEIDESSVLARCSKDLSFHKVPAAIRRIERFPVVEGPNGPKIRRSELRELGLDLLAPGAGNSNR